MYRTIVNLVALLIIAAGSMHLQAATPAADEEERPWCYLELTADDGTKAVIVVEGDRCIFNTTTRVCTCT